MKDLNTKKPPFFPILTLEGSKVHFVLSNQIASIPMTNVEAINTLPKVQHIKEDQLSCKQWKAPK